MLKFLSLLLVLGQVSIWANPVNVDQEMALEELFNEEDLAALKDEEESVLFDEISQSEGNVEELFQ